MDISFYLCPSVWKKVFDRCWTTCIHRAIYLITFTDRFLTFLLHNIPNFTSIMYKFRFSYITNCKYCIRNGDIIVNNTENLIGIIQGRNRFLLDTSNNQFHRSGYKPNLSSKKYNIAYLIKKIFKLIMWYLHNDNFVSL